VLPVAKATTFKGSSTYKEEYPMATKKKATKKAATKKKK
jgi:hypothetical protein